MSIEEYLLQMNKVIFVFSKGGSDGLSVDILVSRNIIRISSFNQYMFRLIDCGISHIPCGRPATFIVRTLNSPLLSMVGSVAMTAPEMVTKPTLNDRSFMVEMMTELKPVDV